MNPRQQVLIVDDKKENLLAMRRVLADLDIDIVEAAGGNEALAATLDHDFALAILDIMMPDMDGFELAGYLKGDAKTRNIPIIFLTAVFFEEERIFKGYEAGAVDYIVKPYKPEVLLSKVRVFLDLERVRSKLAEKIAAQKAAEQELRESESLYRAIARNFPDGAVYIFDHDLRFRVADGQAMAALGFSRQGLEGKTIWEATDEETCRILEERCLRVLAGESLHFETPLKGRVFSSAYVPIRDERGKIIFGMVVNHDITDRKRAEEELQKLNETLEQHVIERTALAEARARQLQALAAELIAAEERERRRMAELLHDDLQQILASARMQILSVLETKGSDSTLLNVEHLLVESIAKSRRLSHELSPAILHHSGLVPALNWLAQQMDKQFGLQVQLETQKAQQLDAASLKVFIFRSVQELLFNIVKHAGVKSARIVLFNSNDRLSVSVIDHGRGFDPGILDFSAEKAGFGLLSIKERAQYVGGCLSIESTPGSGSRLILTVPLNLPYESKTVQKIPSWENSCSTAAGSDSISDKLGVVRLVFVDDHAVIREGLITLVAGQPNIEVVGEAADGRQALELARNLHPHVIVMDVSMPVMDGVEATRRIKAEMPHVRVIALSMFEEHEINQRMREAGAEAFISKNASAAELLSAIYRTAPDVALPRQKDS